MRKLHGFLQGIGWGLLWITQALDPQPVAAAQNSFVSLGTTKAGKSQPKLELRRDGATLQAATCERTCDWENATTWTLEAPFDAASATFTSLALSADRQAAHVVVSAEQRRFEVVVTAPLTGTANPAPITVFAGETGLTNGEAPDRTGKVVEVLPSNDKTVNVVVGNLHEDVSLCGRKALLSPRVLHPNTLTLKGIKLQRLPSAERDAAPQLTATPLGDRLPSSVLTPLVASSGSVSPAVLADDDTSTTWTEGRGGGGGGEFVVFRAPSSLGLTGLTFSTPSNPSPSYRAPTSFWVATSDSVYRVDLPVTAPSTTTAPSPESASPPPTSPAVGATNVGETAAHHWHVEFPAPVQTSCVAISLDTAPNDDSAIDVGFAEVGATTNVDERQLAIALGELDSGGDRASAAEQLLIAVGNPAFERVKKRYLRYSPAGRMRALNVLDAAACRHSVDTYVEALFNEGSPEAAHGERGLARCKNEAIPALTARLPKLASERTRLLTNLLVRLDPVAALDAMTPHLSGGSRPKRQVLQHAFANALQDENAAKHAGTLLANDPGSSAAAQRNTLFLLRALGERLPNYADVAVRRLKPLLTHTDFATRYLALAPAALLSAKDESLARYVVDAATRAKEPAIRTEAVRVLGHTPDPTALVRAIDDAHVRVREAAVIGAGERGLIAARAALHRRLEDDAWPLVRSAAVRALGQLPPDAKSTKLLAQVAEDDASPHVRRPAVHVLGLHDARAVLPTVRDIFYDDPDPDVRATAASSLGLLCDRSMTNALTKAALQLGNTASSEEERLIGKASLLALGRLAPPDLEQRLAPFFQRGVPHVAQAAAKTALNHPEPCTR
jgi:HEAT repeat protein